MPPRLPPQSSDHPWFRALRRHPACIVAAALVAALAVVWGSLALDRRYEVAATLQVHDDPELGMVQAPSLHEALAQIRAGAPRSVVGEAVMAQAMESAGLPTTQMPRLIRSINVRAATPNPGSGQRLVVSCRWTDPVTPARLLAAVTHHFTVHADLDARHALQGVRPELEAGLGELRARVAQLTQQRQRFHVDDPAFTPESAMTQAARLPQLRRQAQDLAARIARDRQALESMPTPDKDLAALQARRQLVQQDLAVHLNQWGRSEDHPLVVRTRARLAELDDQVAQAEAAAKEGAPQYRQAREALAALERQADDMAHQVSLCEQQLKLAGRYAAIGGELAEAAAQLRQRESDLARLATALAAPFGHAGVHVRIIRPPQPAARAVFPRIELVAVIAIVAAALAAVLALIVARALDRTVGSVRQAMQCLDVPILGAVDQVATGRLRIGRLFRCVVWPPFVLAMVAVLAASVVLVRLGLDEPQALNELIQAARQGLSAAAVSTTPGEG
jgi:uncharacterized protein involved in exopolysaccharide biosynthesis